MVAARRRNRAARGFACTLDPKMGPAENTEVQYESGSDVTLECGPFRFSFAFEDFAKRVQAAAVALGVIDAEPREEAERIDLIALAAAGRISEPRSPLGAHLSARRDDLVHRDGDVTYWLRRLVFRGAWLDQQIKEGRIDPVFEESAGFRYRSSTTGDPVLHPARLPDWSAVRYRANPTP